MKTMASFGNMLKRMVIQPAVRVLGSSSTSNASINVQDYVTTGPYEQIQRPVGNDSTLCPRIEHVSEESDKRMLHIHWADGSSGRFPYVWLRDNCPAPHTYSLSDTIRARKMLMGELDLEVMPKRVDIDPSQDRIYIEWPNEQTGAYSTDWLKARNLDDTSIRQRRREFDLEWTEMWDSETINQNLTTVDFNTLMTDDRTLLSTLTALLRFGIVSIVNAPGASSCADLGEHVGFTFPTHYNLNRNRGVDQVRFRPDPGNLQYTANALGLHTDLPQFGYPPETQMLHAVKTASIGGANQFVDGFRVAETMRIEKPELFRILANTEFEFLDHGHSDISYCLHAKWPTIRLNEADQIEAIHYNNAIRSWFINTPVSHIPRVYEALKTFNNMCYDPKFMFEMALQPGQIMWFGNNRVLHGRSSFEAIAGSERHMENLFVNWDAVKSRIRVLRRKMNLDQQTTV